MDSPLLALLGMTTGLSWQDVADGGRMLAACLEQHGLDMLLPAPGAGLGSKDLDLLLPEAPAPAGKAAAVAEQAQQPAPCPPGLAALPGPLAALLASSGFALPLGATLQQGQEQPARSSSSSEDTCGVEVEDAVADGSTSAGRAIATDPAVSSGSSLASNGTSRAPKGGLGLPPRARKARS